MAEKLKIAYYLCSKTDPWIIEAAISVLAIFFVLFNSKKRNTVKDNLKAMGLKSCNRLVYKTFYNMIFNIVIFFRTVEKGMDEVLSRTKVVGLRHLDKLPQNKGCIVMSCHLGLWDLAARFLTQYSNRKVCAVAEFKNVSHFHYELMKKIRGSGSVEILPLESHSTSLKLAKFALKTKGIIALIGDRDISGSGKETLFFGRKSFLPIGPAHLAARLDIPVYIGYLVRTKAWNYRAYISEPFFMADRQLGMEILAEMYFEKIKIKLEKIIRENPDQWIMFYPPWIK